MDFWNGRDFDNMNNGNRFGGGGSAENGKPNNDGGYKNGGYGGGSGYGGKQSDGSRGSNLRGNGQYSGFGGSAYNTYGTQNNGQGNRGGYNSFCGSGGCDDRDHEGADKTRYEEKFNEYRGRSEDELTSELLKTASELKKNGSLNVAELEDFCNRASAFLTPEQLNKMRSLIGMLK